MAERPRFGVDYHDIRQPTTTQSVAMFSNGEDLPLFSGTPIPVVDRPFVPEDASIKQTMLPGMPEIDYERVLQADKALRGRRRTAAVVPAGDIFTAPPPSMEAPEPTAVAVQPSESVSAVVVPQPEQRKAPRRREKVHPLREVLAPYLDFPTLRRLAANREDLTRAYIGQGEPPPEIQALLDALAMLVRPIAREQITSPEDMAVLFMLEMAHLDQEQLRVACLNSKNYLQKIQLVYQGSLNASMVRVGEVYKEPLRLNSAGIIVAHNHPSGDPTPSPEDVIVTREIVQAGQLLDVECLDHLVIGQGRWVSMRQRNLGFSP